MVTRWRRVSDAGFSPNTARTTDRWPTPPAQAAIPLSLLAVLLLLCWGQTGRAAPCETRFDCKRRCAQGEEMSCKALWSMAQGGDPFCPKTKTKPPKNRAPAPSVDEPWPGELSYSGWTLLSSCGRGHYGIGPLLAVCRDGASAGIQVGAFGLYNSAHSVYGIQVGAINYDVGYRGTVVGIRLGLLNLGGFQRQLGLQLGVIDADSITSHQAEHYGLRLNAFEMSGVSTTGIKAGAFTFIRQINGLILDAAHSVERLNGVAISALGSWAGHQVNGLQIAFLNHAQQLNGVQIGFINLIRGKGKIGDVDERGGVQISGLVEEITERNVVRGVQIGVVNYGRHLKGVMIGVVNIATENFLPFFPGILVGW